MTLRRAKDDVRHGSRRGWETGPGLVLLRECPQCPAGRHDRCMRWVGERVWESGKLVHGGEGRWTPMAGAHDARRSPGGPAAQRYGDAGKPCDRTERHGSHWHGGDSSRYCRGVF